MPENSVVVAALINVFPSGRLDSRASFWTFPAWIDQASRLGQIARKFA